jgi:outer membrane protein
MKANQAIILIVTLLLFSTFGLIAQDNSILSLSLENAKQLALQNNLELKNASLDVKAARKKVWETTAIGLPHASGEGAYAYMLTVPSIYRQFIEQSIPETAMDSAQRAALINQTLEDMRASTTFDITVTQLIFSGAYIVGLQTSKVYKNLSAYAYEVKTDNVLENVINAYLSVLIAKENIDLLSKTLKNVESTGNDMKQLYGAGMIDEISYNQVEINRLTIKNALSQIERQYTLASKLLKFQLGVNISDSITLTDNLDGLISQFEQDGSAWTDYSLESDYNYKLVETQEDLMKQNYNLNKTSFLPSIAGFYTYHKNLNDKAVEFTPQDMVGVSLSLPLFSSTERIAKLSQARISYEQAKNNTEQVSTLLTIGVDEARSSYMAALDQISFNRQNLTLANKIYDQTLEKNRSGMASSAELSQSQVQLLTIQGNYYLAIFQLANAKIKLDKAFNKL